MTSALDIAVLALSLWRITYMLARERGPFDVFERVRVAAGFTHDDDHNIMAWPDTWAANLLSCVWCLSMMIAFVQVAAFVAAPDATLWACLPFALSAGAIIADGVAKHGNR